MKENPKIQISTIGISQIENIKNYDKYTKKTPREEAMDEDVYDRYDEVFDSALFSNNESRNVTKIIDEIIEKSKMNPEDSLRLYNGAKNYLKKIEKEFRGLKSENKKLTGIDLIKFNRQIDLFENRIKFTKELIKELSKDLPKEEQNKIYDDDMSDITENKFSLN